MGFGLKSKIKKKLVDKRVQNERKYETFLNLKMAGPQHRMELTDIEKKELISKWGKVASNISFEEFEVFKYFRGFDANYMGHDLYLPIVARKLNNYHYSKIYEDKCLTDTFCKAIKMPETVIRCINGEFYDKFFTQISKEDAINIINKKNIELVCKPARDSSGGFGVIKISRNEGSRIIELLDLGISNFVVQKCVKQNVQLAKFNESSVNTFRVTTLLLNGKFDVCSIILRFGNKGILTDNFGSGGNVIAVNKDGSLQSFAYNNSFDKIVQVNDFSVDEIRFDFIPELLTTIEQCHRNDFPLSKLIGWDITIDESGEPVVIEINSSQPGIFMEQIVTGPIFGSRTQEVIDYVLKKEFRYE